MSGRDGGTDSGGTGTGRGCPVVTHDTVFTFFALAAIAAYVTTIGLWVLRIGAGRWPAAWRRVVEELAAYGLVLAALVAAGATAGSLYLSEVAGLVPCELCWYQRIAMYPLAAVLAVAAWRRDWSVRPFALTLALGGGVVSTYHYLVQRFPDLEGIRTCEVANPCTATLIWKFHHVSIPFMALWAFALVATILVVGGGRGGETAAGAAEHRRDGNDVCVCDRCRHDQARWPGGGSR